MRDRLLMRALAIVIMVLIVFVAWLTIHEERPPLRLRMPYRFHPAQHYAALYVMVEGLENIDMGLGDLPSQNVHDTNVNQLTRRKYQRLLELVRGDPKLGPIFQDIEAPDSEQQEAWLHFVIKELRVRAEKRSADHAWRIKQTLRRILHQNTFTFLDEHQPPREGFLLLAIYLRICSDSNASRREDLTNALLDQLRDCWEDGAFPFSADEVNSADYQNTCARLGLPSSGSVMQASYVCAVGRVTRYFSVFTLLDADETLAAAECTNGILRTEAFNTARRILTKAGAKYPEHYERYQRGEEDEQTTRFTDRVQDKIREILNEDYSKVLDREGLDRLIVEACAGV